MKALALLLLLPCRAAWANKPVVTVGSKNFTESYVLAEIIAQTIENAGEAEVVRKFGLGGTGFMSRALLHGDIDLYPEYSGTIAEAVLKNASLLDLGRMKAPLERMGLISGGSLGFNNTYALAVRREFAARHRLQTLSDLSKLSEINAGFSHEFMKRGDGYPNLLRHYTLPLNGVKAMEHSLAYEALKNGEIDLTDVYSTDAKIKQFDLVVLEDDRGVFPEYLAVILARQSFVRRCPRTWAALGKLENGLNEREMIRLNALADVKKKKYAAIAQDFLKIDSAIRIDPGASADMWERTRQHLYLVSVSLAASLLAGLPLGILAARRRSVGQAILAASVVIQTIPSLALLCFLIPVFGIGPTPALVALFLYGLLPIVLNTYTGLVAIDRQLLEAAQTLGMSPLQRLRWVELPLAARSILDGIRTSAVVNVATATLAALIGAGGYGVFIVTGLAMNDFDVILRGAVPSAAMALAIHFAFNAISALIVSKGL